MKQITHLYLENRKFTYTIEVKENVFYLFEPDILQPEAPRFAVVTLRNQLVVLDAIKDSLKWQAIEVVNELLGVDSRQRVA
jgi:hypothetical protein